MAPSVLIIGASGNVGPAILEAFVHQKESFSRIAVLAQPSRNPAKFDSWKPRGIDVVVGEHDDAASYKGFDVVISLVGNHLMKHQPAIVDAAVAAGVTHFYPSELGCDIERPENLQERYYRDKHITRRYLREVAKKNPEFKFSLLVCGNLSEYMTTFYFGVDTEKKTFKRYNPPNEVGSFTSLPDAARYLVSSILVPHPAGQQERVIRGVGYNHTWAEAIAILEKVQGVTYSKEYREREEAYKLAQEYKEKGDVDQELLSAIFTVTTEVPGPWAKDSGDYDFEPESVESALKRALKA